jgi:hypothetical protein
MSSGITNLIYFIFTFAAKETAVLVKKMNRFFQKFILKYLIFIYLVKLSVLNHHYLW